MNYILFDDNSRDGLLPLTFTRPVAEIRIGIFTIREKWEKHLKSSCSYITQDYLSGKYKLVADQDNILINGSVLPCPDLVDEITKLEAGQALVSGDVLIAVRLTGSEVESFDHNDLNKYKISETKASGCSQISALWQIFRDNGEAIASDYALATAGRRSAELSSTVNIIGDGELNKNIFVEEGAFAEYVTLNVTSGPVYIGRGAEIMEGSVIRGPFALCDHSTVKMSAKIYGPTTIGSYSKVGGEINNCVIFGYSNKAHDGFLGNSVIGEWCNIGADSNNSNLKNNYADVRLWNYSTGKFDDTGLLFCGLIMGDHSKCGINTMFNTGTVAGVCVNLFGQGFPRNFIPDFSWGGAHGFIVHKPEKAFETASKVMERRSLSLEDTDKDILAKIFELTEKYRKY